jgi:hypothetical protein
LNKIQQGDHMRNTTKFTLALLMATAMSIPAYAAGNSSGSGGGASAGSTSSGGTGGSDTGATSATGSIGTSGTLSGTKSAAHSTIGSTGVGTGSSGTVGTRIGADTAVGARTGASVSAGVNANGSTGSATGARPGSPAGARSVNTTNAANSVSFNNNDADRSGTLSLEEYRSYTGTTGANAQIQDDFRALDTNRDNYLSQTELSARASGTIR